MIPHFICSNGIFFGVGSYPFAEYIDSVHIEMDKFKYIYCSSLTKWIECLLMDWETRVQSQVESYQRLKKKMVLDTSLLNNQYYKVCIKGKMEQSRESSALSLHLSVVAIKNESL